MSRFGNSNVHSTRRSTTFGRLAVDVSNTAFFEGKEYRVSLEYAVGGTPLVLRFDAPGDFILQRQALSCDAGNIRFRAYRDVQGVESGTFGNIIPIYSVNLMAESPAVMPQAGITSGGEFTPNEGEPSVETIRLRTSGSTAQRITVTSAVGDERGLPAGVYYLVLARMDGSDTAAGVFDLSWEER